MFGGTSSCNENEDLGPWTEQQIQPVPLADAALRKTHELMLRGGVSNDSCTGVSSTASSLIGTSVVLSVDSAPSLGIADNSLQL
jgi:hypothetical protein